MKGLVPARGWRGFRSRLERALQLELMRQIGRHRRGERPTIKDDIEPFVWPEARRVADECGLHLLRKSYFPVFGFSKGRAAVAFAWLGEDVESWRRTLYRQAVRVTALHGPPVCLCSVCRDRLLAAGIDRTVLKQKLIPIGVKTAP